MKRKFYFPAVLLAALALICLAVYAGQTVFIGALATVNGTTNTPAISIGQVSPPQHGSFLIQNDGTLTNINELTVNIQISLDNTNFLTIATYHPSATSVTSETFVPPWTNQTIYMRAQAVTTNAVGVGGIYQF